MPAPTSITNTLLYPLQAALDPWYTSSGQPLVMTYQFAGASQPADLTFGTFSGWTAFTTAQVAAVNAAIAEYEAVIHVDFQQVTGAADPDINLGLVSLPSGTGGQGGFSYSYTTDGFGNVTSRTLDSYAVWNKTLDITTAANRQLLLHEFGHAMLLKHPGAYDVGGNIPPGPYLPTAQDNQRYTVMSYTAADNGLISDHLMLYDIAALQARFGANLSYHTGNDTYTGSTTENFCIWDAGGFDTIDGSNFATAETIDLRDGNFSSVGATNNLSIAYDAIIEYAIGGTGNDTIIGNSAANSINGNLGADTMIGGGGDDTYYVENAGDVVTENNSEGPDQVFYANMASIPTLFANVEYGWSIGTTPGITGNSGPNVLIGGYATVAQTLSGGDGSDYISGTPAADILNGGLGDDTLLSRGGGDQMTGGDGNDSYYVESLSDTVVEGSTPTSGSADIVYTNVNYNLAANVEYLFTYGAATSVTGNIGNNYLLGVYSTHSVTMNGGGGNDVFYGSNFADTLIGSSGNDTFFGSAGGADGSVDTMQGGGGNDIYFLSESIDVAIEGGGGGTDVIYAAFNETLPTNFETLFIYGSATTATGNSGNEAIIGSYISTGATLDGAGGNDTIIGGAGNDIIIGGTGADSLTGAAGNDTFTFHPGEANGDTIVDFAGVNAGGGDKIRLLGYGGGASFTLVDATHWQVNYNAGTSHEVITIQNSASINLGSDVLFV